MMTEPWRKDEYRDIHVLPTFGRPHEMSGSCWCRPKLDPLTELEKMRLWVHVPEN